MAIVRAPRKAGNFTVLSNSVLLDQRLSMRALGLLVRLLARPDNWRTNSDILAREFDCGRDQMRSTMRELASLGYVRLVTIRDEAGRVSSEWHVFDDCSSVEDQPGPEKPYSGQPVPENPGAGGSGRITKTDLTSTDNKQAAPGFLRFWSIWPKSKRKGGKPVCLSIWNTKRLEGQAETIIAHVKAMAASQDWTKDGGAYIPAPAVYLRGMRWDGAEVATPQDERQSRIGRFI